MLAKCRRFEDAPIFFFFTFQLFRRNVRSSGTRGAVVAFDSRVTGIEKAGSGNGDRWW